MTFIRSLLRWAAKKWETAEDWLPKAIAIGMVPAVIVIYFISAGGNRGPAGFVEISDSDVPTETMDHTHQQLRPPLLIAPGTAMTKSAIERRLGLVSLRARAVIFDPKIISELKKRKAGQEYRLPLALFPGFEKVVHLKVISGFEVNKGLHSGVFDDDESSKVQLSVEDGSVSIFIESSQGRYRIIHDPISGYHYVVQVE